MKYIKVAKNQNKRIIWEENLAKERVGEISKNRFGSLMEIVEYNKANDIWVKFLEYGNLAHVQYDRFIRGEVKNPYDKSVYGVGYIGEGEYKIKENGLLTPQYETWKGMLCRCYCNSNRKRLPTYAGCSVSEDWHNFQTFCKWYDENFYEIERETMCLDKDILVKGNKIYSPNTCVFVTKRINSLFVKGDALRGKFPIGVRLENSKYKSYCKNINGKRMPLGTYGTPEEAFEAYKTFKEKVIIEVAEEHKDRIPTKLYDAMLKYVVDIND